MLPSDCVKSYIVTVTIWTPSIEGRSGPLYQQIGDALIDDIRAGRLPAGTRLPTLRDLATALGVTTGTVSRAYEAAARRGLVSGEVGRGTFVRAPAHRATPPDVIDLGTNVPPPTDDGTDLARTLEELAAEPDLGRLLAYPPEGGHRAHREAGVQWIRHSGLEATADEVMVSSGGQHGLAAIFLALLSPGDVVAAEALTYPGMKTLASLMQLRLVPCELDEEGMRPDALERACRESGVRAVYCVPTLHNPTVSHMGPARRREIAEIVRRNDVILVEDDVHSRLLEEPLLPISAHVPERAVYLTGTAKALDPGLRIGYAKAPPDLLPRLAAGIRATTWTAAPLMAEIVARWIVTGVADALGRRKRAESAARHALASRLLPSARLRSHPMAHHVWLELPDGWSPDAFVDQARRRGVVITPSRAFTVGDRSSPPCVRIALGGAVDRAALETALATVRLLLDTPPESHLAIV